MAELEKLSKEVIKEFPRSVFFAGKLVFRQQNLMTRALHNHTPSTLQERLQFEGLQMVVVPVKVSLAAELAAIQGEQSSTGTRRLVSDVRAGGRVCLGVWVTALVALAVASRRVHRTRPTTRN